MGAGHVFFKSRVVEGGKIGVVLLSPECGSPWVMSTSMVDMVKMPVIRSPDIISNKCSTKSCTALHLALLAWPGAA